MHSIEIIGHRGARGLAPENTLAGFAAALAAGVNGIELDVGVTRDGEIAVLHDRRLNPDLVRDPSGEWISETGLPIHRMEYRQLLEFDVGRLNPYRPYGKEFTRQIPADGARIPTLADVVRLVRAARNEPVWYEIELKLSADHPEESAPPDAFAAVVIEAVYALGIASLTRIRSFHWGVLQRAQSRAPSLPLGFLTCQDPEFDTIQAGRRGPSPWTAPFAVTDFGGSVARMVQRAGGNIWAPYHADLTASAVAEAHELGLRVSAWTVNEPDDIRRMIEWGIDGIISDYPDRVRYEVDAVRPAPLPAGFGRAPDGASPTPPL